MRRLTSKQRDRLLRGAAIGLCAGAVFAANPGLAQDQQGETAQESEFEEIVVTGTRIQRSNLVSPNPVSVVDSEDVTLSGDVNVVDIVDDIPALIGSTGSVDNAVAFGSLGAATLNLRNLGTERTLVLVDGRRHVGGISGTATVDVNTIPSALVERVEVLTGGASAVYGADAVTGVVNFILKDDFEGFDTRAQFNISDGGDSEVYFISSTAGGNFADGRGNATLSVQYENQRPLRQGDRSHTRNDRIATDFGNPAFRIQQADVAGFGLDRLLLGQEVASFCGPGDTTLGSGRDPLCNRIEGAPEFAVLPFPRFAVSNYGSLIGVDFFGSGFLSFFPDPETIADLGLDLGEDGTVFDFNGNGVEDCFETAAGTLTQRFGGFAGCHVIDQAGSPVRVFQDGLIIDDINQFGGDGTNSGRDGLFLQPKQERIIVNGTTRYELFEGVNWFAEGKLAYSEATTRGPFVTSFFDSIPIRIDNPFIPQDLRSSITDLVNDNPDVFNLDDVTIFLGRDPTDFGPNVDKSERTTLRVVTGFEGDISDTSFSYEVSFNYGRTDADTIDGNALVIDRFYAALDAVEDPATGEVVCRSSIETDANGNPVEPGAAFLPSGAVFPGFDTFDPTDGTCVPVNIFGIGAPSAEAVDFITRTLTRNRTLEQTVISGFITGDSSSLFTLPAGPIGFAGGAEYREEKSSFDAPFEEEAGFVFDPRVTLSDVNGRFDVWEIFGEVSVPLLSDLPFARDLSVDGAVRYGDYSTVGGTTSWKVGGNWSPTNDLSFRGTFSRTIRAPNIDELFSPLLGATARPIDPCDASQLDDGSDFRAANCAADGIPTTFTDPLTARISGFTGGNPDLTEETADTFTLGVIVQPRFIPGFTLTADFYSIDISDAIDAPGFQEIVNACYDLQSFPNDFCGQFERDRNPNSPTFLGLRTFTTQELNFVSVKTQGIDYEATYEFELGDVHRSLNNWGSMRLRVAGNWTDKLNRREDPTDPTSVNRQLFEGGQPRHAFNIDTRWFWRDLTVNLQSRYIGNVLEITPRLQIENADNTLNAFAGSTWRHDLSGTYRLTDTISVYGGVNNLADEKPLISEAAFPVGLVGRQFFLGIDISL